jgi:hypothetical protein
VPIESADICNLTIAAPFVPVIFVSLRIINRLPIGRRRTRTDCRYRFIRWR